MFSTLLLQLKCTGEQQGCRRCLAKHIECTYPKTPAHYSRKESTETSETPSPSKEHNKSSVGRTTSQDATVVDAFDNAAEPNFEDMNMEFDLDVIGGSIITNDDFCFQQTADSYEPTMLLNGACSPTDDAERMPDIYARMSPSGTTIQNTSPPLDLKDNSTNTSNTNDNSTSNATTAVTDPLLSDLLPANVAEGPRSCPYSCISQAVHAYEAIEVSLVWSARDDAAADETLQHQKRALARCEELLGCDRCCAHSEYVALLLSMCDRIMGSVEDVYAGAGMGVEVAGKGRDRGRGMNRRMSGEKVSTPSSFQNEAPGKGKGGINFTVGDALGKADYGGSGSSGGSGGSGRYRSRLRIRQWQLDDDDELRVLQSLLAARVAKLGGVIGRLEGTIRANYWPAHESMVRCLRERFTEASVFIRRMFSSE